MSWFTNLPRKGDVEDQSNTQHLERVVLKSQEMKQKWQITGDPVREMYNDRVQTSSSVDVRRLDHLDPYHALLAEKQGHILKVSPCSWERVPPPKK